MTKTKAKREPTYLLDCVLPPTDVIADGFLAKHKSLNDSKDGARAVGIKLHFNGYYSFDAALSRLVRVFRSDIADQSRRRYDSIRNCGDIPDPDRLTARNRGTFRFGWYAPRNEENNDRNESHSRLIHDGFLVQELFRNHSP
jgi:hypothetical protein